ncbi:MAG: DUF4157 domain-containing protein [Pseudonocardiaceae bacterium]
MAAAVQRTGMPLEPAVRREFEHRLGHDFSTVRIHSDGEATRATAEVGANAYTLGRHIAIREGLYNPSTTEGRRLLTHELTHVAQQAAFRDHQLGGLLVLGANHSSERQARAGDGTATPLITPAVQREPRHGTTDWIEDAYDTGSLNEIEWHNLLDSAKQALARGQAEAATSAYLTLYSDVAQLAQATRVVRTSGEINVVTGNKGTCKDARPGLNFSPLSYNEWGANATTAYVDDRGKFGVTLNARGAPQPEVAIVLCRQAFLHDKEQTLGILRHEMVHAEDYAQTAVETFLSDPKAKSGPLATSSANTELLAYFEGFMTIFHLTHPAPTSADHPAFIELLGALDTGKGPYPWKQAEPSVRTEALSRLQEYYCNVLDQQHREAFDAWVDFKITTARRDQIVSGKYSTGSFLPGSFDDETLKLIGRSGDAEGARLRVTTSQDDFFRSLQGITARKCKGLTPPMRL